MKTGKFNRDEYIPDELDCHLTRMNTGREEMLPRHNRYLIKPF